MSVHGKPVHYIYMNPPLKESYKSKFSFLDWMFVSNWITPANREKYNVSWQLILEFSVHSRQNKLRFAWFKNNRFQCFHSAILRCHAVDNSCSGYATSSQHMQARRLLIKYIFVNSLT